MHYKREIEELLEKISEKPVMVLATSLHDSVSARNMSVAALGDKLYFQTDRNMKKAEQIQGNSSVALCIDSQ
jgi:Pyridoxamine 5''-phosphate oxidase.